jgi:CHAT domain-containing protein
MMLPPIVPTLWAVSANPTALIITYYRNPLQPTAITAKQLRCFLLVVIELVPKNEVDP